MGLSYLQKKSWSTASLKNIEKVWKAEQKRDEQIKRQKELAKKLQEERDLEELKMCQVKAGLLPNSVLDRMDWMYERPNAREAQNSKQISPSPAQSRQTSGANPLHPIFAGRFDCLQQTSVATVKEDPLFAMIQKELETKEESRKKEHKKDRGEKKKDKHKERKKSKRARSGRKHKSTREFSRSRSASKSRRKKEKNKRKDSTEKKNKRKSSIPRSLSRSKSRTRSRDRTKIKNFIAVDKKHQGQVDKSEFKTDQVYDLMKNFETLNVTLGSKDERNHRVDKDNDKFENICTKFHKIDI